MVEFFTATLLLSCVVLVLLLAIKRWELTTGRILGAGFRPHMHLFFHTVSLWIEHILPTLVRVYAKLAWKATLRFVHKITALGVLYVERTLERILRVLQHSTDVKRGMGEASVFLREVSEHKRKLLRTQSVSTSRAQAKLQKE